MLAQAAHEVLHASLVGFPLLNVTLDLHLGVRQLLVELLQVCLWFDHQGLLSDVAERLGDDFVEAPRLLDELLLYSE